MTTQPDRDWGGGGPARSSVTAGFAQGVAGFAVAVGGAILALVAFFVLPFASLFFFSVTGAQVAGSGVGGSVLLWLMPLMAVGAIGVSGRALWDRSLRSGGRRSSGVAVLGLGGAGIVLLGVCFFSAGQYARLVGVGFWLSLVGMLAVAGGGLAACQRPKI
jgi:hypothetical protein